MKPYTYPCQPGEAVLDLIVRSNTLTVTVTAQNGTATRTYTVTVERHTATTLVSNTHLSATDSKSSFIAQSFETGANLGGYTVSEVDISLGDVHSRGTSTRIRIREDNGGEPGALVATLTNPASLTTDSLNTFTAPAGTTLAASTIYWITTNEEISPVDISFFALTGSDDDTSETGWSIGDGRLWRTVETDSWTPAGTSLLIAIKGTPIPTISLVSNTHLSATESSNTFEALSFETGANLDGYTVTEVDIRLGAVSGRSTSVKIRKNNADNEPGDLVATLTNPGTLTSNSLNAFTAPAGTMLAPSTTYWLTVSEGVSGSRADIRLNDANAETGETGWSIGDSRLNRSLETSFWDTSTFSLLITIKGTVVPCDRIGCATGRPTISGVPQVGKELTAGTSDIEDVDGLPATFTYQWVRIAPDSTVTNLGIDSSTYTVSSSDVDSTIRIDVSFTDLAGNSEGPLPSKATAAVVPAAAPCPAGNDWCTTMTVGTYESLGTFYGFSENLYGRLDEPTIDYGRSFEVEEISILEPAGFSADQIYVTLDAYVPPGTVFNLGGTEFTANAGRTATSGNYSWSSPANFAWIDGQEVMVSANLAPAPESATVEGTTLVLTHSEDLNTGSVPAASAYTVRVDGDAGTNPSTVSVGTRTVTLTLATAVTGEQVVTVSYDVPASNPLQDVSGRNAPAFADFAVTNKSDPLVSNTHLSPVLWRDNFLAQMFKTGTNADGYTVSEVDIRLDNVSGKNTSVKIRENNADNEPGDLVTTLTNPGTLTSKSLNTFTAPAGTTLAASTTYWISVNEGISSNRAQFALTNLNDETGETGWSIGDDSLYRNSETASWRSIDSSLLIAIRGTALEVTLPAPRLPAEDDPQAVWLATLTVASLGSNQYGYDSAQCGRGSLTDTAFTYLGDNTPISQSQSFTKEGTLYTITKVYYETGLFQLSLDQRFAQDTADTIAVDVDVWVLRFSNAAYSSSSHTYSWSMPDPSWSAGDEVPVKIVVLKDADGPDGLAATTTLSQQTGPSGHKYETRNLTLTWSAPTSGEAVTGYRVEYQPDPAFQWKTLVASQPGTTYTQSGKLRDVVDYYRVAALRSGEPASYSDIVRVQVPPDTPKVPQRVAHVEAGPAACSALKVAWNRADTPISKNGNGVGSGVRATGYQVQYAPDGLTWRNWSGPIEQIESKEPRQRSPDLKTVITGLAPNRDYQVRLRSCNDAGCAEWTTPTLAKAGTAAANAVAKTVEAQPLTVSLASAPEAHDGESGFQVQIAFSEDVEITPEDMRDHALVVSGGTVTDAAMVKGRKDLWKLTVEPAGLGPVSILAPQDRACTETGALCTADGRSLTVSLALQVPGPPAQQANSPATGAPSISGTPQVGEMLTADTSGITDADGLVNVTYSYQWLVDDTDIAGATSSTYTLVDGDEGQTIKVRVIVTDDAENETTLTSAATDTVAAPEPPAKPTGLSAAVSHDTVTLTWDNPQDDSITGYVILRRDREIHLVGTFITITGDTGSADTTYPDDTVEPDKQYVYRIKAINEHGEVSEESDWVRGFTPAAPQPDSPATGQPTISGTAQVGEELTADTSGIADTDGLTNVTYSYQWLSGDAEISGVTGSTYTLVADDVGRTIKVRVTFTDDAENETTLTSAATTEVAAKPNTPATGEPTISGTVQVSQTLTADTSAITDADGLTNVSYSYQWVVTDGGAYIDIPGETGANYTLVAIDRGLYIQVRVSFADDAGNREKLTSAVTEVVVAAP